MKKSITFLNLIAITLFLSGSLLLGQERRIEGAVTTFDSIPLIGATIKVKSTQQEVLSDTLGLFTVLCNPEDRLHVTANGFISQRVKVDGVTKNVLVNLRLKSGEKNREYAVGYGHVKDKDKLYAIASLEDGDHYDFSNYRTMHDLINGKLSGVSIVNNEIVVRGMSTYSAAGSAALIIIDGVPSNEGVLFDILPRDVQSIDVLKDGSAAIWGSRGANGVLIVKTKNQ